MALHRSSENNSLFSITPTVNNRNGWWVETIFDALVNSGIRHVHYGAGGRSAALCFTAQNHPQIIATPMIDERVGSFIALGQARATSEPVALLTTSGSAVANLLPALTEAHACSLPLILLTADRPCNTRGLGPVQSTDQLGICAPLCSGQLDLPDPEISTPALQKLYDDTTALFHSARTTPGPVHLNIPQYGIACSTEADLLSVKPPGNIQLNHRQTEQIKRIKNHNTEIFYQQLNVKPGLRGLIICGPDANEVPQQQLATLANQTDYPVIADCCSGFRHPDIPGVISCGDFLVRNPHLSANQIEIILRLGLHPVSPPLQNYLAQSHCPVIQIGQRHNKIDFLTPNAVPLPPSSIETLGEMLSPGNQVWQSMWQQLEQITREKRQQALQQLPWGELGAATRVCQQKGFSLRHFGNSMSVRLASLLSPAMEGVVFSNRGVNGIDGTMSSFLGELLASPGNGLLMLGDQSMLHDLSALAHPCWQKVTATICVINNGGGVIFEMVSAALQPAFEETMRNPPNINIAAAANTFGHDYRHCDNQNSLEEALDWSQQQAGVQIIDIVVPSGKLKTDIFGLSNAILD